MQIENENKKKKNKDQQHQTDFIRIVNAQQLNNDNWISNLNIYQFH